MRRFADGSVGLIISFAVPSHSEPIAHSELRFSHHQSPISSINQPIIIELYDYSLPNSLLDRKQVLPDTDGRHTKSLNASAFDISRAIKRAHRTGAASVNLMLKFVPAIQSASFGGGRRVRRDTATAAATVRNEQTLQALDAHMFTYVKDTERRSSSQVESSSPSQRRTRRSADPEEIGGVFNKLFSSRSKRHRFQRGRRQQTDSLAAIGGHNANVRGRYGNDVESNCKRRYMFVNFTELGLSQVILAPDGYVAWFCKGPCMHPLGAHMNATTHATLQSLMHLMQPGLVPSPCCSPTSLSGLSMLVKSHEDDTFTVKVLKDMVVDSCGCRWVVQFAWDLRALFVSFYVRVHSIFVAWLGMLFTLLFVIHVILILPKVHISHCFVQSGANEYTHKSIRIHTYASTYSRSSYSIHNLLWPFLDYKQSSLIW